MVIQNQDTVKQTLWQYEVEVYVLDATEESYTVQWSSKNMGVRSTDPMEETLAILREGLTIVLLTNEFGAIREVLNWKEIRNHATKVDKQLQKLLRGNPIWIARLDREVDKYQTRETIEEDLIKNAMHFHTFYGTEYRLDHPLTARLELNNPQINHPLEANIEARLDTINWEENTYDISMKQWIDVDQQTRVDYNRLRSERKRLPAFEQFPKSKKMNTNYARMHGPTGWVIISEEKSEETVNNRTEVWYREIRLM